MFRFSVIVPFYNRPQFVDAVLDSIQAQTFKNYEVICVDDGSTDNTLEILKNHPLIKKVISIQNSGPAIARNQAAKIAQGEYLAFLDSDDLWFEDALDLADQWLMENNSPSVLTTLPLQFSGKEIPDISKRNSIQADCEIFPNYLAAAGAFRWHGVSSFIIKLSSFKEVAGFTSLRMNAEDADLMLKLGMQPIFAHYRHPPIFAYRTHNENLTADFEKSYNGLRHILKSFHANRYPSSTEVKPHLIRHISMHLRPGILQLMANKEYSKAKILLFQSLSLHIRSGKLKFVFYSFFRLGLGILKAPLRKI